MVLRFGVDVEGHLLDKRKFPIDPPFVNQIQIGPIGIFLLSGRSAYLCLQGLDLIGFVHWFWVVLERYKGGQNWKRIFEKTRVGFGRTEVSLPVCLQSGLASIIRAWSQGTGVGFDRGGILYFWGALLRESKVKIGKVFLQKQGSALVIQRFRYHSFAQCFAFYHMGVVLGDKVLKGLRKPKIYVSLLGVKNATKKHENA